MEQKQVNEKDNKVLVFVLIVLLVIAVAVGAIMTYLYLNKDTNTNVEIKNKEIVELYNEQVKKINADYPIHIVDELTGDEELQYSYYDGEYYLTGGIDEDIKVSTLYDYYMSNITVILYGYIKDTYILQDEDILEYQDSLDEYFIYMPREYKKGNNTFVIGLVTTTDNIGSGEINLLDTRKKEYDFNGVKGKVVKYFVYDFKTKTLSLEDSID